VLRLGGLWLQQTGLVTVDRDKRGITKVGTSTGVVRNLLGAGGLGVDAGPADSESVIELPPLGVLRESKSAFTVANEVACGKCRAKIQAVSALQKLNYW